MVLLRHQRRVRSDARSTSGRSLGPGFSALFAGSLITNTGDGIRLAALPLLASSLTSSPLVISAVTAAQVLPWVTVAPIGGVLVDRHDRRRTILTTQTWRGLIIAALAVLVWADLVAVWHICVVAFLITAGEILVDPSVVALVPQLVQDRHLESANGRIASVEIITNDFAGGPIGAATFATAPWLPFLIDGASYLGSLVPFRKLPAAAPAPPAVGPASPPTSVLTEAREGFSWLRAHPILGPFTAAQVLYYFGLSAALSLLVVHVTIEAGASEIAFGLVLAAGALGAFAGALLGGRIARAIGARATLSFAVAAQGATLICVALVDTVPLLIALWFVNGIPAGVQRPVARGMQQRLTPNHLLGRINVTARIFTRGVIVIGALAAGALATAADVRWSFIAGGTIQVLAAAAMWRILARSPN